jgi:hypothetical protein
LESSFNARRKSASLVTTDEEILEESQLIEMVGGPAKIRTYNRTNGL